MYLALAAAGRIPDPFGDRAEKACAWVKDREWWWRTDFETQRIVDDQRLMLEFQGLDTYATVWLNGETIGRSENMFRAVRFDITARVRPGKNRLAVCFRPTSSAVMDRGVEMVWRAEGKRVAGDRRHVLTVRARDNSFPANRHFLAPIKDLDRPSPPAPEISVEQRGTYEVAVHLATSAYLYFVHLLVADERTRFSDNYFDLDDGETKTVIVRNEAVALSPNDVVVRWR